MFCIAATLVIHPRQCVCSHIHTQLPPSWDMSAAVLPVSGVSHVQESCLSVTCLLGRAWCYHMTLYLYMAVDYEAPRGDRLAMHRTHDMCEMLQSESIALRQTLQHALENSPACRARSSSRGHIQAAKGTRSALKHMSFLAERAIASDSANHRRCCSPMLNRYAGLQEDTAQCCIMSMHPGQ